MNALFTASQLERICMRLARPPVPMTIFANVSYDMSRDQSVGEVRGFDAPRGMGGNCLWDVRLNQYELQLSESDLVELLQKRYPSIFRAPYRINRILPIVPVGRDETVLLMLKGQIEQHCKLIGQKLDSNKFQGFNGITLCTEDAERLLLLLKAVAAQP